jgi:hypothetical protein
MEAAEAVMISREALNALEQRAVSVNGALLRMHLAINSGNLEAVANLQALAQELNWTNRRAMVDAGAVDSTVADRSPSSSTVWDDDEPPVSAEKLDLAALRSEFGESPE